MAGQNVRMASLHPKYWSVCRVDAGGATLVVAGRDSGHVEVWNPAAGRTRKAGRSKGPALAVCPVRLQGRTIVASAGVDHTVWLWDPVARREITRYTGHPTERITQLCAYRPPDDRFGTAEGDELLVTAGNDGVVLLLNPATGEGVHVMGASAGPVQGMCRFRDGGVDRLATAGLDAAVRIWDIAGGTLEHTLTGHDGWVHAVCPVTVGGQVLVASGGDDGIVRLWDPRRGRLVRSMKPRDSMHTAAIEMSGGGTVYALREVRSRPEPWLAVGGDFPGVWLWDPATGRAGGWVGWEGALDNHPACGWVRTLATYPTEAGPHLLVAGYDDAVNLFTARGRPGFSGF
jgi:WD40 repeat protein